MQGPEIRTGFLKDSKPVQLTTGKEVTITTDYDQKGDATTIAMRHVLKLGCDSCSQYDDRSRLQHLRLESEPCSYKKLPVDMKPGMQILCADGSIVLEVISADPNSGTVRARCMNNAVLG